MNASNLTLLKYLLTLIIENSLYLQINSETIAAFTKLFISWPVNFVSFNSSYVIHSRGLNNNLFCNFFYSEFDIYVKLSFDYQFISAHKNLIEPKYTK